MIFHCNFSWRIQKTHFRKLETIHSDVAAIASKKFMSFFTPAHGAAIWLISSLQKYVFRIPHEKIQLLAFTEFSSNDFLSLDRSCNSNVANIIINHQ